MFPAGDYMNVDKETLFILRSETVFRLFLLFVAVVGTP